MANTSVINLTMRKSLYFILFLTLSVVVPFLFHLAGLSGTVFIPIYAAVILATLTIDPILAIFIGIATPFANNIVTGMPAYGPMPMLQMLIVELIVLSVVISLLRKANLNIILVVVVAIILARLSSIIFVPFMEIITLKSFISQRLISWPGMLINALVAVVFYKLLNEGFRKNLVKEITIKKSSRNGK